MWDEALRELKDVVLKPVARLLLGSITANQMTILGLVLGLASAVCFAVHLPVAGMLLWGLNRVADGLDGTLARLGNKQSDFGGFLDLVCDLVVYAAIPVGLTVQASSGGPAQTDRAWLALSGLLAVFYVNIGSLFYLSALIQKQQQAGSSPRVTSVPFPSALIEGFETVVFYTLFMAFPRYLVGLFTVFSLGCVVNIIQRFNWFRINATS